MTRFGKFGLVGAGGAVVQLLLVTVLTHALRLAVVTATGLAVELTVLHNFAWHEQFTWRDRSAKGWRERIARLWRFHTGNGFVSLGGNMLLMYVLAERLHIPAVVAAATSIAICSLLNYWIADRWVYEAR